MSTMERPTQPQDPRNGTLEDMAEFQADLDQQNGVNGTNNHEAYDLGQSTPEQPPTAQGEEQEDSQSFMTSAQRQEAQAIINAEAVVSLPEGPVRSELYAMAGINRNDGLEKAKQAAAASLERDTAAREADRAERLDNDNKAITAEQNRYVTENADDIDNKVAAVMESDSNADLKPGAASMMRENLRVQISGEVATERRATIEAQGGAKMISKIIEKEKAEATAATARETAERARVQADHDAEVRRLKGFGSVGDKVGLNNERPAPAPRQEQATAEELIRPAFIKKAEWVTMGERARKQVQLAEQAEGITSTDPEMRTLEHIAAIERRSGDNFATMPEEDRERYKALSAELETINQDSEFKEDQLQSMWRTRIDVINGFHDVAVRSASVIESASSTSSQTASPSADRASHARHQYPRTPRTAEELGIGNGAPAPSDEYELTVPPQPVINAPVGARPTLEGSQDSQAVVIDGGPPLGASGSHNLPHSDDKPRSWFDRFTGDYEYLDDDTVGPEAPDDGANVGRGRRLLRRIKAGLRPRSRR